MNRIVPVILLSLGTFACRTESHAQDTRKPGTAKVLIETIEVGISLANNLTSKHRDEANAVALRDEVEALLKDKKATLHDCIFSRISLNQAAKIGANEEIIHPTEYEPGFGAYIQPPSVSTTPKIATKIPTVYETRLAGTGLEVHVNSTEQTNEIEASLDYELTVFLGKEPPIDPKRNLEGSVDSYHWIPKFHTSHHRGNYKLTSGNPVLINVFKSAKNREKRLLVFLTVWTN